jgi:hypothetical protein
LTIGFLSNKIFFNYAKPTNQQFFRNQPYFKVAGIGTNASGVIYVSPSNIDFCKHRSSDHRCNSEDKTFNFEQLGI